MPISEPHAREADAEALQGLFAQLQRYAGWLAKDHASTAVRASVQALGAALEGRSDTSLVLQTLDKDLGRLPSGEMRKMLRKGFAQIRAALEATGVEVESEPRR